MQKESTFKSVIYALLMTFLAIVLLEILTQVTFTGTAFLSTLVYAIFDSRFLAIVSIIIALFIGGGAIISAFIYMAEHTVLVSPNKWLSLIIGIFVAGIYLYLTITTYTPINTSDNFIDIPMFVYDIPIIIYGLLTMLFSFTFAKKSDY